MPRLSIIIPDNLIDKLDSYKEFAGYTRSELIRYLIRQFFNEIEQEGDKL